MITSLWSDWPWKTKQASHKMMHDFSKFVYPRQMWKKKVRCCVWSVERILSFRGDAPNLQEPNTMMTVKEISLLGVLTYLLTMEWTEPALADWEERNKWRGQRQEKRKEATAPAPVMDVTATEWTPTIIDRLQIFQSAILLQFIWPWNPTRATFSNPWF